MDIQNSATFLDIQISILNIHYTIFGYPKFDIGYPKIELWISNSRIMDIQK